MSLYRGGAELPSLTHPVCRAIRSSASPLVSNPAAAPLAHRTVSLVIRCTHTKAGGSRWPSHTLHGSNSLLARVNERAIFDMCNSADGFRHRRGHFPERMVFAGLLYFPRDS